MKKDIKQKKQIKKLSSFQVRLPVEIVVALKGIAEDESRSLNGQIEYILKKFIENEKIKK